MILASPKLSVGAGAEYPISLVTLLFGLLRLIFSLLRLILGLFGRLLASHVCLASVLVAGLGHFVLVRSLLFLLFGRLIVSHLC